MAPSAGKRFKGFMRNALGTPAGEHANKDAAVGTSAEVVTAPALKAQLLPAVVKPSNAEKSAAAAASVAQRSPLAIKVPQRALSPTQPTTPVPTANAAAVASPPGTTGQPGYSASAAAATQNAGTTQQADQTAVRASANHGKTANSNSSSNVGAAAQQLMSEANLRPVDAVAAWQSKPAVPVRLLDTYVNYLILGESGLGKTTCIHNLVSSYSKVTNKDLSEPLDGSATSLTSFQASSESLKTVVAPMDLVESGKRLHVAFQDTPGWSDDINTVQYLRKMTQFVLEQRAKDYKLMAGARALDEVAMCGQLRHSITACLYFITPHRLKKVDVIIMCALSQLVTVIPVIAKADTMTETELMTYRQQVCATLQDPSVVAASNTLPALCFNNFGLQHKVLSGLDVAPDHLPLALITSRDTESMTNPNLLGALGLRQTDFKQPVRRYRWGAAYAFNHEHSDLLLLKRLLLGDKVGSLYALLDESYRRYVEFCQQYEDAGQQVPVLVQTAAASSTPYLDYEDYRNAKTAVESAQQAMKILMAENKALLEKLKLLQAAKKQLAERDNGNATTNGHGNKGTTAN